MANHFPGKENHITQWRVISPKMMQEQGVFVTHTQCCDKFNALKKRYREVTDHNNKSGNCCKDWYFFYVI